MSQVPVHGLAIPADGGAHARFRFRWPCDTVAIPERPRTKTELPAHGRVGGTAPRGFEIAALVEPSRPPSTAAEAERDQAAVHPVRAAGTATDACSRARRSIRPRPLSNRWHIPAATEGGHQVPRSAPSWSRQLSPDEEAGQRSVTSPGPELGAPCTVSQPAQPWRQALAFPLCWEADLQVLDNLRPAAT